MKFGICAVMLSLMISCGVENKKVSAIKTNNDLEDILQHQDEMFKINSENNAEIKILFYDKEGKIISAQENNFPVGALKGHVVLNGQDFSLESSTYTTCCSMSKPVSIEKIQDSLSLIEKFELKNDKFSMAFEFSNGDKASLRK